MLDDAAFFACSSVEPGFFVLTVSFHLHFLRRVTGGLLLAEGKVVQDTKTLLVAEAFLYDEKNREVARGSGEFVRSSIPLSSVASYCLSEIR
jgi:acyl-coenzyme A thioesterase PaaI-like protein